MRLVWVADEPVPEQLESLFELSPADVVPNSDEFFLRYQDDTLCLCRGDDPRGIHVRREDIRKRLKGDFMLGRACEGSARGGLRIKDRHGLRILDAMAGLGTDGVALALRGHTVTLVERNPALWALLDDLLHRLEIPGLELRSGDCREFLQTQTPEEAQFDVVYLDPMFPQRAKRALPGKQMQYVAALLEAHGKVDFEDSSLTLPDLIQSARGAVASHVVLKRRRTDPTVGNPDWQLMGRSVRYDMFRRL